MINCTARTADIKKFGREGFQKIIFLMRISKLGIEIFNCHKAFSDFSKYFYVINSRGILCSKTLTTIFSTILRQSTCHQLSENVYHTSCAIHHQKLNCTSPFTQALQKLCAAYVVDMDLPTWSNSVDTYSYTYVSTYGHWTKYPKSHVVISVLQELIPDTYRHIHNLNSYQL